MKLTELVSDYQNTLNELAPAQKNLSTDLELIILEVLRRDNPEITDVSFFMTKAAEEFEVPKDAAAEIQDLCRRRMQGEPLAYILGYRNFYGRDFVVSPDVLIPRPETETMIDLAKQTFVKDRQLKFLEIGTGSGCIAITLALEFSQAEIMAADISEQALQITEQNAKTHNINIKLVKSNLLENIPLGGYDAIFANLPYVDREWDWLDQKTLGYEPDLALYTEEKGLKLYKKFIQRLSQNLKISAKFLFLEADPCQHAELCQFAAKFGWRCEEIEGFILRIRNTYLE